MRRSATNLRTALFFVVTTLGAAVACADNGGSDRPPPIGANGGDNGSNGSGNGASGGDGGATADGGGGTSGSGGMRDGGSGGDGGSTGDGGSAGTGGSGGTGGTGDGGSGGTGGTAGSGGTGGSGGSGGTAGSGGSGGDPFGGSGGSPSHECTLTTNNSTCDNCIYSKCDAECVTCEENAECVAIISCIKSDCMDGDGKVDGECALQCRNDHPSGSTDFNKLVGPSGCGAGFCPASCQFF